MSTKTQLFVLPNELFPFIFQYLNSADIVHAFIGLRSHRFRALIHPFISHLDIADQSDEWVQIHLPMVFNEHDIHAIRLRDKHLISFFESFLSNNIQSVQVLADLSYIETFAPFLEPLRRQLKTLSIKFLCPHEDMDLIAALFKSDSQIQELIIDNCILYFDENAAIDTCTRLKSLSVELEGTHRLFILLKHSPVLEELKVKFISNECLVQPEPNTDGVSLCPRLCRVTMTGCVKYFDHLAIFFALFGSTFEYLSIDIDLMWRAMDGEELEQKLLNQMPHLFSFNFSIRSIDANSIPIEIETFKSFAWNRFQPIIYWNDSYAQRHTICTLPYRFHEFSGLSNDYVSSCVSSQSVTLRLNNVRSLSLCATTPFTLETFEFIREVFPKVQTLECTRWFPLNDDDEEEERPARFMDTCLLSNTSLQLPSITQLCLYIQDHVAFHRLLHLLPNMIELKLDARQLPLPESWQSEEDHEQMRPALTRIKRVKFDHSDFDNEQLTKTQIQCFFPNATIIADETD